METINIHEAKTHLSRLVEEAAEGAEILIAKNGVPRARLMPLERARKAQIRRVEEQDPLSGRLRRPAAAKRAGAVRTPPRQVRLLLDTHVFPCAATAARCAPSDARYS